MCTLLLLPPPLEIQPESICTLVHHRSVSVSWHQGPSAAGGWRIVCAFTVVLCPRSVFVHDVSVKLSQVTSNERVLAGMGDTMNAFGLPPFQLTRPLLPPFVAPRYQIITDSMSPPFPSPKKKENNQCKTPDVKKQTKNSKQSNRTHVTSQPRASKKARTSRRERRQSPPPDAVLSAAR